MKRRYGLVTVLFGSVVELICQAQLVDSPSQLVRIGPQPGGDALQVCGDSNLILTYAIGGLWQSSNGGINWNRIRWPGHQDNALAERTQNLLEAHCGSRASLWIRLEHRTADDYVQKVYRTSNGGGTWTENPSSPLATRGSQSVEFYLPDGITGWEGGMVPTARVIADPKVTHCKAWGDGRSVRPAIFHTVDGGKHWSEQALPESRGCNVEEVLFWTPYHGIAVADHEVYYTVDRGDHWYRSVFLPPAGNWLTISSWDPTRPFFYNATVGWLPYRDGYLFRTGDGAETWREIVRPGRVWREPIAMGGYVGLCFITEKRGWMVGGDQLLYETKDGGTNWVKVDIPTPMLGISCANGSVWTVSEHSLYRIDMK